MGLEIKRYGVVALYVVSLLLVSCGGDSQPHQNNDVSFADVSAPSGPNAIKGLAELYLVPAIEALHVAEIADLDVYLDNAIDLYGLHLSLKFDPTLLQVHDSDPNAQGVQIAPGALPAPDFIVLNKVDNERGIVEYAVVQLNPREPAQGNGVVASINFEGIGVGVSPVEFSYTKLSSPEGQEMPAQVAGVTLEINQPQAYQGTWGGLIQVQD